MEKFKILTASPFSLIAIVLLSNCYTTGGEDPPPVAEISGVFQEPAEISPTDTAKFTVIITSQRLTNLTYSFSGNDLASGIYFYVLQVNSEIVTGKMLLLK